MGTSKGYGGPPNGLVPSWLESPAGGSGGGNGDAEDNGDAGGDGADGSTDGSSVSQAPGSGALTGARTAFTRFSKNGSSSTLGAALAGYVRGGNGRGSGGGSGGARRAAQRMGASRATGSRLLGVVRDFQRIGALDTLRRLDLDRMVDRPATEVFLSMLEFLCPPGGAIDEAISRQAMLEAIGHLDGAGPAEFGQLTPEQLREFFLDFVSLSIEGRVIADIGSRGITLAADVESVERTHEQLRDFINGCCRAHLSGLLTGVDRLTDREVEQRSNEIYEAAFQLIADAGEDAQ
ncbi:MULTISPECIES: Qat anti-phage system associated protein QatB [Burkholderiales]|uniref:Qat anti-phage system associated protein QatB n=1 Tax=Burkholderiales TaxID=80840 RepID=UPI0028F6CDAB|nr:Qat anti-phage system associated protein QatB [Cupriavidus gilardii]